jgi:hypothetical protein
MTLTQRQSTARRADRLYDTHVSPIVRYATWLSVRCSSAGAVLGGHFVPDYSSFTESTRCLCRASADVQSPTGSADEA